MISTTHHHPTKPRNRWAFLIWLVMLSLLLAACGGSGGTGQSKTYTIGVAIETQGQVDIFKNFKAAMVDFGYVDRTYA